MAEFEATIKEKEKKIYSKELLEILFKHPYTKIEFLIETMGISRQTASSYLEKLVAIGLLKKEKEWKENFYINTKLLEVLS